MNRLLIVGLMLLTISSFAQSGNWQVDKLGQDYAKLSYQRVITDAKTILKRDNSLTDAQRKEVLSKLSYSLYNINDYKQAEEYFQSLASLAQDNTKEDNDILLKYAKVLAGNGKHAQSSKVWSKYGEQNPKDLRAGDFTALQSNTEPLIRNAASYETYLLPINTNHADFSPTRYAGGLVFVSGRGKNTPIKRVFAWDNSSFLDLFYLDDESQLNSSSSAGLSSSPTASIAEPDLRADYFTTQTANDGPTLGLKSALGFLTKPKLESDRMNGAINSSYHDGPCQFYNNGESVIFTRNGIRNLDYVSEDGVNRIHLYMAKKIGDQWGNLEGFPYNDGNYSTGHPAFMPDENILFFASDMPGGFGGVDIYFSKFHNGEWLEPQNAGITVNTEGNEMFPYIDEQNNLYFSSDGHPGLGGLDIFTVSLNSEGIPISGMHNLGAPLNSAADDFGILTDSDLKKGYFSSNRKRGGGDDDIYSFTRIGEKFGCKDVLVTVKNDNNGKTIAGLDFVYYESLSPNEKKKAKTDNYGNVKLCLNAESNYYFEFSDKDFKSPKVHFHTKGISDFRETPFEIILSERIEPIKPNILQPQVMARQRDLSDERRYRGIVFLGDVTQPLAGIRVRFINKCTDETIELLTAKNGQYDFIRDPSCDYEFTAIKAGYATNYEFVPSTLKAGVKSDAVAIGSKVAVKSKKESESFFDPKVFKVGDFVKLDNIYYETKDYELASNSKNDLDQLVLVMRAYPAMVIEVFSHTDSRGEAGANLILSQKRADAVKGYLTGRGVDSSRIKAVGMGEESPINKCGDGIQCTEAEYRRNRRTEFKILQIERI